MFYRLIVYCYCLLASLATFSQNSADIKKGDAYLTRSDYTRAVEFYKKAVAAHKTSISANEKLGKAYLTLNDPKNAEAIYSQLASITPEGSLDRFYYAQVLRMNGKYSEAGKTYDIYFKAHPNDPLANEFRNFESRVMHLLTDTDYYKITDIPENTSGSEVGPTFCFYFFCYSSNKHDLNAPTDNYDLYIQRGGNPSNHPAPEKLKGDVNGRLTEGPATFSRDGKEMIFTRSNYGQKGADGKIKIGLYHADYDSTDKKWINTAVLNFIDYDYNFMQPSLSTDGSTLYFASDIPGGFGGIDIYVCHKQGNAWSAPVNLGSGINTMGSEQTPFLSDRGILFFASDSRMGLGGLDMYSATATDGVWGHATNLGAPLNTAYHTLPFSTWEAKIPKLRIQPNPRAKYKVGEQIKRKRVELGMTEDDIAALLGVEAQTIHAWEFGTRVPLPKQTSKLIGFLGYDPYEVI